MASANRYVKIETRKMRNKQKIRDRSNDELQLAANDSHSFTEMLVALGYSGRSGSMWVLLKKICEEKNIDTSHFRDPVHKGGGRPSYSLNAILVPNSKYTNIDRLKKRLLAANMLEYKCAICGNVGEWNGKPLSLQLDHIDGVHNNHSLKNLRFLCPNCHSQTETFSGKKNRNR